ncbi:MAG: C10 family peptidase [Prevotella sp.]|nr:C10 family peptidase [Prevotella sp.]
MKKLLLTAFLVGLATNFALAQKSINPMMAASWHQSAPFNDECPDGSAAGCGAIAVAQILSKYKMPAHGFGRAKYENVDVDFDNRSINWSKIRDSYPQNGYSGSEGSAVASLVYQVGAAMKMKYGTSSSPHNYPSMMWGLQHYLHFSPKSRYRHRHYYSTAEWIEMLNKELQGGHPVFYRGDHTRPGMSMVGHMYVIDGYNTEGQYHFNFGHASKSQDKYTDLNIINQGEGVWPGIYSVSYHHRQAMVTDFYPVDGLSDSDYDHTALVLNSPIVLEGKPNARTIEVKGTVSAKFQFRYVSFTGGSCQYSLGFYRQDELMAVSRTIRNSKLTDGGYGINVDRSFTLPDHLADGDYEMSIISRDDENSPWVRGWDNAPNRVPVSVRNEVYSFTMPNYHTLESSLYLEDGTIHEVKGVNADGRVLELTVCNPSDNNFEDSLRLVVKAKGKTHQYNMVTSIYDGQRITYRFLVANNDIDTTNGYTVEAYYKEVNTGDWVRLTDKASYINMPFSLPYSGVEIYSIGGVLLKHIESNEVDNVYSQILSSLPKGIYIICDKNGVRKFTKRL